VHAVICCARWRGRFPWILSTRVPARHTERRSRPRLLLDDMRMRFAAGVQISRPRIALLVVLSTFGAPGPFSLGVSSAGNDLQSVLAEHRFTHRSPAIFQLEPPRHETAVTGRGDRQLLAAKPRHGAQPRRRVPSRAVQPCPSSPMLLRSAYQAPSSP